MSQGPAVHLKHLSKRFGAEDVLVDVDLRIPPGDAVCLIGPSAAGKTVMAKCLSGLLKPEAGEVLIDGVDTIRLKGAARREMFGGIGVLFQQGGLFDSLPVWRNVCFRLLKAGMKPHMAKDVAVGLLADVGLDADVADLSPADLSGGMRKRVGIARALATDPRILILDEPTAGLDPVMSTAIVELIQGLGAKYNPTVLAISSNMDTAQTIADTIALVHNRTILWHGPAAEAAACGDPHVEQLVNRHAEGPIQIAV